MAKTIETLTREQIQSVAGKPSREAARILGVKSKSTINEYRRHYNLPYQTDKAITDPITEGYSFKQGLDGNITASTRPTTAPQTLADAEQLLVDKSVDISRHNVTYGYVEKELASGKKTHQYTIRAVPKRGEELVKEKLNTDELIRAIDGFDFTPLIKTTDNPASFVITPSDMQIGKTSYNGGTPETQERVLNSFAKAVEFVKEFKPREIVIAELGDPLENFYNTSSQRETNDLDLTGQIRVARRLLLDGIKQLAPYASAVRYATVPSNHGTVRVGFKAPAGDNHNDWGIEIAAQIEDAVRENSTLGHVSFHKPERLHESMLLETAGTKLGLVHGHQSRSADKLGEWWKGQDHGRQPVGEADILLSGHWHSFRVYHSGNARWIMVSPASDPGSDWFTNITGEHSETGMLSFTTQNGMWENLTIL